MASSSADIFRLAPEHSSSDERRPSPFSALWELGAKYRILIASAVLLGAMLGVISGLMRPRTYTSSAAFMGASSSMSPAGLSGIAAQFGVRIPTGDATQSPQFYHDLVRSRALLDSVVGSRFQYRAEGAIRTGTLEELLGATGSSPGIRRENAIAALDATTSTAIGRETGVIRVSVSTVSPQLSAAVVDRMLELINEFNLKTRQSRAAAERRFAEARLSAVEAQLRAAEERLAAFRRENRQYLNSPELIGQSERLQRDVATRQQVYTSIIQAYEQARIDEVRDTPVITIVESPYVPVRPDRRGLLRLAILGGVLGLIAGMVVALGQHTRRRTAA